MQHVEGTEEDQKSRNAWCKTELKKNKNMDYMGGIEESTGLSN